MMSQKIFAVSHSLVQNGRVGLKSLRENSKTCTSAAEAALICLH